MNRQLKQEYKKAFLFLLFSLFLISFIYSITNTPKTSIELTTPNYAYCLPGVYFNLNNPVYNIPGVIEHMEERGTYICRENVKIEEKRVYSGPIKPGTSEKIFRETGKSVPVEEEDKIQ